VKEVIRSVVHDKPILIGIRGNWYDVTSYVGHHPGGDVLLEFAGQDATAQFLAYHDEEVVLRHRKPVGTGYVWDQKRPGGDALEGDYLRLHQRFKSLGYFKTDMTWLAQKVAITFGLLLAALFCVVVFRRNGSAVPFFVGAVALAGFWQQSGFLMHDFLHNQIFHHRKTDQACGWFFASVCFGISARWWRDEHNEHHLFTNTVISGVGVSDPQMGEAIWAQDPKMFQFFKPWLLKLLLKVQHIIFLPTLIFVGPIGIKIDSYLSEDRPWEFLGVSLHWLWVVALISQFPTYLSGVLFWYTASCCVGVLEIQLLISHYSKDFEEKVDSKQMGFMRRQVTAVVDIDCPTWMDWFHGGLNLHSVHHCFPRISRQHYRSVFKELRCVCTDNGIKLDVKTWCGAVAATLRRLQQMDTLFSIDPR